MQRLARCYHAPDETVFFEIMPVGRRYLAATIGASAFECPAGPVSALLVSKQKTRSVFRFGYFSPPALRRDKASRSSPMKTKAS